MVAAESKRARTIVTSWVPSADEHPEFPIQNLPFGVFSHVRTGRDKRIGVAIGNSVLDMRVLLAEGLLDSCACATAFAGDTLNAFMAQPKAERGTVRALITNLLEHGGNTELSASAELQARCLVPRAEVQMHLPATIGDYTDFYSSREHATNVGIMFRGKDNALQPNWLHLPVGYHGRASSVVASGTPVVRPHGQLQLDKADPTKGTEHAACRLLDFELEMGFFVGGPPNALGVPLTMAEAEDRLFGYCLCNDWSARDIQKFEYVPLGPFGAKNFATTIGPWVVMAEALQPFKCATSAGAQTDPVPLPYLRDPSYGSYDVELTVGISPAGSEAPPTVISTSNYRHLYWTSAQQLVHHSVTGCDMRPGDLLASGTISGAGPGSYGSMLELSWQGTQEVGPLADGTKRKFLKDGDTVAMRGICKHPDGFSIGFGECDGLVLPANSLPPAVAASPPACVLNEITLMSYWRSTCSWRVRTALAFYGVPYSYQAVNLLKGEQHEVGKMAQVPRLDWIDAGGERQSLTQSLPIIELLNDVYAKNQPSLCPVDPLARAKVREVSEVINAGTQPLQNLTHMKKMKAAGGEGFDERAIGKDAIICGLTAVETLVSANRDTRFCVGSHITMADICLVPQLYNARRFNVDLAVFPRLVSIEAHLSTLPCFVAAHPDAQPDAQLAK